MLVQDIQLLIYNISNPIEKIHLNTLFKWSFYFKNPLQDVINKLINNLFFKILKLVSLTNCIFNDELFFQNNKISIISTKRRGGKTILINNIIKK